MSVNAKPSPEPGDEPADEPSDDLVSIGLEQAKALAHPLRRRILTALRSGEHSPMRLATILGENPTKLYRHVQILEEANLIVQVRTEQRRGATERFYRCGEHAFLSANLAHSDGPTSVFRSALETGLRELERLDHEQLDNGDEDCFMSASTEVRASAEALRELSEFVVDWVKRNRHGDADPTHFALTTFPVERSDP